MNPLNKLEALKGMQKKPMMSITIGAMTKKPKPEMAEEPIEGEEGRKGYVQMMVSKEEKEMILASREEESSESPAEEDGEVSEEM
jgi:hypothetical protein